MNFPSSGSSTRVPFMAFVLALSLLVSPLLSRANSGAGAPADFWTDNTATDFFLPGTLEFPFVPDASMTEGALCTKSDGDFERFRYGEHIPYCKRNVASGTKTDIYNAYGVPSKCRKDYTIDHFIPLSIGGNNSRKNLWPEHKSIKALRQHLEEDLYKQVARGQLTQAEAVRIITDAKWNPPVRNPSSFSFCN